MFNVRKIAAACLTSALCISAPASASGTLIGMPAEKAIAHLSSAGFLCGGLILETPAGARTGCVSQTPDVPVTISMALSEEKRVIFLVVNGQRVDAPGKAYSA